MNDTNKHHLDALFRQGLDQGEATPPSASWAQMEALLDTLPEKKKRKPVIVWWAAAAVMVPFLVASLWWIEAIEPTNQQAASQKQIPLNEAEHPAQQPPSPLLAEQNIASQKTITMATAVDPVPERNFNQSPTQKATLPTNFASEPTTTAQANKPPPATEVTNTQVMQPDNTAAQSTETKEESLIASVEFKPGKPEENQDEIATIEWHPHREKRPTLSEQIKKLRQGELKIPSVGEAKENLFALLTN